MSRQTLKIFGSPGCGKTTRLLNLLIAELRDGLSPSRIAFMTFTRAARLEALERTKRSEEDFPYLKTIHALCYKQLGITRGRIASTKQLKDFGQEVGVELTGHPAVPWYEEMYGRSTERQTQGDKVLALDHLRRHKGWGIDEVCRRLINKEGPKYVDWFIKSYELWRRRENLLDYTDLLTSYIDHGMPLPVEVGFVDEAQDLSPLQWQVARRMLSGTVRTYLAGDDDQAIYAWAGADPEAFLREPADQEEVLPVSYRLTPQVQDLAASIINRVGNRKPKAVRPRDEPGTVARYPVITKDLFKDADSALVLFRNHYRAPELGQALTEQGIPWTGYHSPFDEAIPALRAWNLFREDKLATKTDALALQLALDPQYVKDPMPDQAHVSRYHVMNLRGNLPAWPNVLTNLTYAGAVVQAIREGWDGVTPPTTRLMSIHQAKGREADLVIVDPTVSRLTYEGYNLDPDSEHRVFYVACTRARRTLVILEPAGNLFYPI